MERDAESELPPYSKTSSKKNGNYKSNIKNDANKDKQPSHQAVQNIYGSVHNFKDCHGMIHIGHTINLKVSKSKKENKSNTRNKEKSSSHTNVTEPPSYVAAVMNQCLDVLTLKDVEIIRNAIVNTTWHELAKSIKAHANHIKDGLPQAEAVEKVLCSWIEQHSHSALVAILVQFLWQIREVEAASLLARMHCTKLM